MESKYNGSETYCWEVIANTHDINIDASSVVFAGQNMECPYTVNMTASTRTFSVDTGVLVSWIVGKQSANNEANINTTMDYEAATPEYFNLPQVKIYYCSNPKCSPFSDHKTLVYSAPTTNFSAISEMASFSSKIKIPTEGAYTLMAHAVVPNGDNLRFDMASFMRVQVTASPTPISHGKGTGLRKASTLSLILGVATFVCTVVLTLAACRRRAGQEEEQQKERRYSFLRFRSLPNKNELPINSPNSAHGSDESGNFMYVKAQRSPMDMPRSSSLSFPYSCRSFIEAGCDASGYSFAPNLHMSSIGRSPDTQAY